MGMAAAYDLKVMLPTLCILSAIVVAACTFGSSSGSGAPSEGKRLSLGG